MPLYVSAWWCFILTPHVICWPSQFSLRQWIPAMWIHFECCCKRNPRLYNHPLFRSAHLSLDQASCWDLLLQQRVVVNVHICTVYLQSNFVLLTIILHACVIWRREWLVSERLYRGQEKLFYAYTLLLTYIYFVELGSLGFHFNDFHTDINDLRKLTVEVFCCLFLIFLKNCLAECVSSNIVYYQRCTIDEML